ncbi:hypothetical protein KAJ41_01570 [Candidatus Parcubacteria bacterium]|nr:hypothetical protein [Candidatus Parcubacteria bacterium]
MNIAETFEREDGHEKDFSIVVLSKINELIRRRSEKMEELNMGKDMGEITITNKELYNELKSDIPVNKRAPLIELKRALERLENAGLITFKQVYEDDVEEARFISGDKYVIQLNPNGKRESLQSIE